MQEETFGIPPTYSMVGCVESVTVSPSHASDHLSRSPGTRHHLYNKKFRPPAASLSSIAPHKSFHLCRSSVPAPTTNSLTVESLPKPKASRTHEEVETKVARVKPDTNKTHYLALGKACHTTSLVHTLLIPHLHHWCQLLATPFYLLHGSSHHIKLSNHKPEHHGDPYIAPT